MTGKYDIDATTILHRARALAEQVLAPRAEAADRAFAPDPDTFRALCEAGFAGLTVKQEFGGLGAAADVVHEVGEILGAACGCTCFTFHQHWSACGFVQQGDNEELKRRVLPKLASGEWWTGVGFSYLRRPGPPCVAGEDVEGGYRLTGVVPWFSGWPLYRHGTLAAKLDDGREIFLFTSLDESDRLQASPPMALCAMQGSGTVQLTLDHLFIPRENVCFIGVPDWLRNRDAINITLHAQNPIIVAAASVKLLQEIARKKSNRVVAETADALDQRLTHVREQVAFWSRDENKSRADYTPRALSARAHSILLAVRAAHACVVASAGGANALSHPAQRYLREAMFYGIQGQTPEVMEATLRSIADCGLSPGRFARIAD